MLTDAGFDVERGAYGLATAVRAQVGSGPLSIVICAEYDALPAVGHACGHNLIAAASLGAGMALAGIADDLGLSVTVLGTPAEEGGGGKVLLLERGAFDGAHAAMMVHPWPEDRLVATCLAVDHLEVQLHGPGRARFGIPGPRRERGGRHGGGAGGHRPHPPAPAARRPGARHRDQGRGRAQHRPRRHTRPVHGAGPHP